MNELNYTSIEASKKLVENGIVLKTESEWVNSDANSYTWTLRNTNWRDNKTTVPAPSLAELWRELPDMYEGEFLRVTKDWGETRCGYGGYWDRFHSDNPADVLAELLIWVRREKNV
jgi:hypothetical protein